MGHWILSRANGEKKTILLPCITEVLLSNQTTWACWVLSLFFFKETVMNIVNGFMKTLNNESKH